MRSREAWLLREYKDSVPFVVIEKKASVHKSQKPEQITLIGLLYIRIGGDLLSHTVSHAVPSALKSLTTVFGMGTGGSSSL